MSVTFSRVRSEFHLVNLSSLSKLLWLARWIFAKIYLNLSWRMALATTSFRMSCDCSQYIRHLGTTIYPLRSGTAKKHPISSLLTGLFLWLAYRFVSAKITLTTSSPKKCSIRSAGFMGPWIQRPQQNRLWGGSRVNKEYKDLDETSHLFHLLVSCIFQLSLQHLLSLSSLVKYSSAASACNVVSGRYVVDVSVAYFMLSSPMI